MSPQVLVEIQTVLCHRPVILPEKGWEKTYCKYKCTFGQQKGREPGLHTCGNGRVWLGHAVSSIQGKTGRNNDARWGKGALVTGQAQKGLPVHILGLGRENVEGIM